MKSRLILLVIAFALLALAGSVCDVALTIAHHGYTGEATHIAPEPVPTAELPVIERAAVTAPTSAQMVLGLHSRLQIRRDLDLSRQTRPASVAPRDDLSTPQSIPLLI